jgi:hypothetical protein
MFAGESNPGFEWKLQRHCRRSSCRTPPSFDGGGGGCCRRLPGWRSVGLITCTRPLES